MMLISFGGALLDFEGLTPLIVQIFEYRTYRRMNSSSSQSCFKGSEHGCDALQLLLCEHVPGAGHGLGDLQVPVPRPVPNLLLLFLLLSDLLCQLFVFRLSEGCHDKKVPLGPARKLDVGQFGFFTPPTLLYHQI